MPWKNSQNCRKSKGEIPRIAGMFACEDGELLISAQKDGDVISRSHHETIHLLFAGDLRERPSEFSPGDAG